MIIVDMIIVDILISSIFPFQGEKEEEIPDEFKNIFEKLFEESDEIIIISDKDGNIKRANKRLEEILGYSQEELRGENILKIIHPDDKEKYIDFLKKALEEENPRNKLRGITNDEKVVHMAVEGTTVKENEKVVEILFKARDVTEKERVERKLRKAKERYEDLFKGANELVVTTDPEGYIKRVNKKTVEISGYSENELVGESVLKIAADDWKDKYIEFWKKVREEGETKMTMKTRNKDGSNRWIETGGRPIIENGELVEIQYTSQDITERKKIQERQEFLYSLLRHDLRNKVTVVEGYQNLMLDMNPSEEQRDCIDKTLKAARESLELIEKIRVLSKVGETKLEKRTLNSAIKEAIKGNSSEATEKGIDVEYEECECVVKADSLLEQLFFNLIENSIQHSGGSLIKIQVDEKTKKVKINLEDDGKGIRDNIKDEIFERGFKDDESGGTGLGLALVERIIESYGGKIEVADSNLGGAKFTIELRKT